MNRGIVATLLVHALVLSGCSEFRLVAPPTNVEPSLLIHLTSFEDSAPRLGLNGLFEAGTNEEGRNRALVDSTLLVNGEPAGLRLGLNVISYSRVWTASEGPIPSSINVRGPRPEGITGPIPVIAVPRVARLDPPQLNLVSGSALVVNLASPSDTIGPLVAGGAFWTLEIEGGQPRRDVINIGSQHTLPSRIEIPWTLLGGAFRTGDEFTVSLWTFRTYEVFSAPYRTSVNTASSIVWQVSVVAP
jgi:hypothetical protein